MKLDNQVVKPTTHRRVGIVNASRVQSEGIVYERELDAAFARRAVLWRRGLITDEHLPESRPLTGDDALLRTLTTTGLAGG